MYLSRRHVSALAMGHHHVYTNVIRVLYRCVVFSCVVDLPIPIPN
jgi:hypothetical protein